VLNLMNRPIYWKSEEASPAVDESVDGEAMEEDGMDEEEEEVFSEEEEDEEVMEQAEEQEEETTCLGVAAFKRLVDVINRCDSVEFSSESYGCLQATTEDFLVSLIQASGRSSHFAGRKEVTEEDVRFAQLMTQQKW
jgi:histone H3/H4